MIFNSIDAKLFLNAIIQGCQSLIKARETLNTINVFPVADGDTGDNMAATAKAITQFSKCHDTLKPTLQSIANASIMGARGNSGMIFSQFFNGFVDNAPNDNTLTPQAFADLVLKSTKSVRDAIAEPVEGTIISVMDAWAMSLQQEAPYSLDIQTLFEKSRPALKQALDHTTETLAVLKEAHVVDAGALGFFHFVEGMHAFWLNPVINLEPEAPIAPCHHHAHPLEAEPPKHRYCTEALISGTELSTQDLSKQLSTFGDSVVITGHHQLCRFHLHTNTPIEVFTKLRQQGLIEQPKVDDMLRQYEMIYHPKHPIALVTDSSADIPQELLDKYQIHLIPLSLHLDGSHFLDHFSFNQNQFYDELATLKSYPTTSFPGPKILEDKLRVITAHYQHVFVFTLAKALSGTHESFVQAAKPFDNITVVDSKTASATLGLIISKVAEVQASGATKEALQNTIAKAVAHTKLFITVNQVDAMIRSGRLNKITGQIAKFAGLKPILTLDKDGRVHLADKAFSEQKARDKLIKIVTTTFQHAPNSRYAIVHAGVPEKAEALAAFLSEALGKPPLYITPVTTVLGLHAGKDCLAVAMLTDND